MYKSFAVPMAFALLLSACSQSPEPVIESEEIGVLASSEPTELNMEVEEARYKNEILDINEKIGNHLENYTLLMELTHEDPSIIQTHDFLKALEEVCYGMGKEIRRYNVTIAPPGYATFHIDMKEAMNHFYIISQEAPQSYRMVDFEMIRQLSYEAEAGMDAIQSVAEQHGDILH